MSTDLQKRESGELAPASIYEVFRQMALDPSIDVTRIAALMELQIKAEDRNAEKEFNAAFARLLPTLPKIGKHGLIDMGTKGSMKFIKYEDLDRALRPIYTAAGFSLSFNSEATDKGILLVAVLAHTAGHSTTSRLQLPADAGAGRNALQALGSSLSYAKRYLTCNLFNIVAEGEDDDATAGDYINDRQVMAIEDLIAECGLGDVGRSKFLETFNAKSVGELFKANYAPAINLLSAKRRNLNQKAKDGAEDSPC
jgi:hypothetical protein